MGAGGARTDVFASWGELLRQQTQRGADDLVYSFADARPALTVGELDLRARAMHATIAAQAPASRRALVVCPDAPEFLYAAFGCFYAGILVVPAALPWDERSARELAKLARASGASLLLTTSRMPKPIVAELARFPELAKLPRIFVDGVQKRDADGWKHARVGRDAGAVQLRVPWTGQSPGLQSWSHEELFRLVSGGARGARETRRVAWAPLECDMGLLGVLQGLVSRGRTHLLPTLEVLQHPLSWLEAIAELGATWSAGPSAAYELCAAWAEHEPPDRLDLSSWDVAVVGADAARPRALERFARVFARHGFRADAFALRPESNATDPADAARAWFGSDGGLRRSELWVVDPQSGGIQPNGERGELWLRTPSAAAAYWHGEREPGPGWPALPSGSASGVRPGWQGCWRAGELVVEARTSGTLDFPGGAIDPDALEQGIVRRHPTLRAESVTACLARVDGVLVLALASELAARHGPLPAEGLEQLGRRVLATTIAACGARVAVLAIANPGRLTGDGASRRRAASEAIESGRLETLDLRGLAPLSV